MKRIQHSGAAIFAAGILSVPLTTAVLGQQIAAERPLFKRWHFSFVAGTSRGGPAERIEVAMRESGLNKTAPRFDFLGLGGGPTPHPHSQKEGPAGSYAISYRWNREFELQFIQGKTNLTSTCGYGGDSGTPLTLACSVKTTAVIGSYLLGGIIRVGGGPAIYKTKTTQLSGPGSEPATVTRLGLLFDAHVLAEIGLGLHLTAGLQYRLLPESRIGPYTVGYRDETRRTMPAAKVPFSHTTILIGLGFGF